MASGATIGGFLGESWNDSEAGRGQSEAFGSATVMAPATVRDWELRPREGAQERELFGYSYALLDARRWRQPPGGIALSQTGTEAMLARRDERESQGVLIPRGGPKDQHMS